MAKDTRLTEYERSLVITLLTALDTGWAVVDEEERFDYVLLVDESRMEMENFKPPKSLIQKIETMGLIVDRDATFGGRPRETGVYYESSAPNWDLTRREPLLPIVYFYAVTSKGRDFLKAESSSAV